MPSDKKRFKMAKQFLNYLDGEASSFCFQCFHPDRKQKPSGVMYGKLKEWWEALDRYNKDGYGVYVCINETNDKGSRKQKDIQTIRAFWQEDDDGFGGKKLPLKPSMVVCTSEGKYHRYFLVNKHECTTDIIDKDTFDAIQKRLVVDFGSDNNSRDITRVLRVPGFYNTKSSLESWFLVYLEKKSLLDKQIVVYSYKKIKKKIKPYHGAVSVGGGKKLAGKVSGAMGSDVDYDSLLSEIVNAKNYYYPMLSLSQSMANNGLDERAISFMIRKALEMGKEARPEQDMEIWQERYDGAYQMAKSACRKVKEEVEGIFDNASINGDKIMSTKFKEISYWINPIITNPSINMIHAGRGVGKTFFCLSMAGSLGSGVGFLKWKKNCITKCKVLYIDGELPINRLKDQFIISCNAIGLDMKDSSVWPDVSFITGDLMPEKIFPNLSESTMHDELLKNIMFNNYDVVFIDSIATCFKDTDDRMSHWSIVQDFLISLRSKGVTVVLVHHDNKAGDAQRGFSNKEDVLDTVIHLQKPANLKDSDGAKFNVVFSKKRYLKAGQGVRFGASLDMQLDSEGVAIDGSDAKWFYSDSIFGDNYDMTVDMFKDGYSAMEISRKLGITPASVSKFKKRAIKANILKPNSIKKGYKNNFDVKKNKSGNNKKGNSVKKGNKK